MPVHIKNSDELDKMRVAGKLAAEVLELIEPYIISGVSTEESTCRKASTQTSVSIYARH